MSRISSVIAMAKTPSLKASRRPIPRSGPVRGNSSIRALRTLVNGGLVEGVVKGAGVNGHSASEGEVQRDYDEEHTTDESGQCTGKYRLYPNVALLKQVGEAHQQNRAKQ